MRLRILLIGIILLAIATAVVIILLGRTDFDRYRSEIAHQLSRALGREVQIPGPQALQIARRLGLEAPELGKLQVSGKLSGNEGSVRLSDISLEVGVHRATGVKVTGEIGNLLQLRGLNLDATLRAESLRPISPIGPAEISGRVEGSRERVKIREMRARLDKTHFTEEVQGSLASGSRPHLTARLESPSIHLDDVGLQSRGEAQVAISRWAR